MRVVACCLLAAPLCLAQNWELGGAAGYGIYHNGSVTAGGTVATAGIRNRFAAGVVLGQDLYEHLSGEFRYTYHDGDPFLASGGIKTNLQGQSHAFSYEVLIHARPRGARLRPYLVAGGGIKQYNVSNPSNPFQPLSNVALLTSTSQVKPLIEAGGGVKYRLREHALLRFDLLDYMTPFPKRIITPVAGATASGFFHQITPLAGVSFLF